MADTNIIILIISAVVVLFISFLMGYFFAKLIIARRDKKELKDLEEVIDGKRENAIEIDGVKYPAERFRMRDEDGKEILVDLKGGESIQDDKKRLDENKRENIQEDTPSIREDSRSSGEEKRTPRARDGGRLRRRIRRFG